MAKKYVGGVPSEPPDPEPEPKPPPYEGGPPSEPPSIPPTEPEPEPKPEPERDVTRDPLELTVPSPEPTLPEVFTPPMGSKPVEFDAQGRPTVYETPEGVRYYAPGSTMWMKGYRTSEEYLKPQRIVIDGGVIWMGGEARGYGYPAPHASSLNVTEAMRGIARSQVEGYDNLSPREQFTKLIELGLIEPGSTFGRGESWNFEYYPKSEYRRMEALDIAEKEGRADVDTIIRELEQRDIETFKQAHTELPDGQWVGKTELINLKSSDPEGYEILTTKGMGAYGDYFKKLQEEYIKQAELNIGKWEANHMRLPDGNYIPLEQWNNLPEKYQTIALQGGFPALTEALEKGDLVFRNANTELPDGTFMDNVQLQEIKTSTPKLYETLTTEGYSAYLKKIEDCKTALSGFYDSETKRYNVAEALLKRKPELTEAIDTIFDQSEISEIRREILPGLTIGTKSKEEPQLFLPEFPPILLAGAAATLASPVPGDEIVALVVLLSLAGYGIVRGVIEAKEAGIDFSEIPYEIRDKIRKSIQAMGGLRFDDVVVIDKRGAATSTSDLLPKLVEKQGEWLVPPRIKPVEEEIIPPRVKAEFKPMVPPRIEIKPEELVPPRDISVAYLPTPTVTTEELTGQKAGVMSAVAEAEKAVKTVEIDWDAVLEEAKRKGQVIENLPTPYDGAEDIVLPRKDIATWTDRPPVFPVHPPLKISEEQYDHYKNKWIAEMDRVMAIQRETEAIRRLRHSIRDYGAKLAILQAAKTQYIEALNPQPIKGISDDTSLNVYSQYVIKELLEEQVKTELRTLTSLATQTAIQTYTEALAQNKTATQAQEATQTAVRNMVKTATQTKTLTKAQITAVVNTAVNTAIATAAATRVATRAATRAITKPAAAVAEAVAEIAPVAPLTGIGIPSIPFGDPSEMYSRGEISGYVTFNMGWQKWGIIPPFTQSELLNLGRVRSTGTPQETLRIVGEVPSKISFDIGVTDGYIDTVKGEINFRGEGEKTDVGIRHPSTTKGISIPATEKFPQLLFDHERKKPGKEKLELGEVIRE